LEHILRLGGAASTEWYFQPWRWIVVRSETGKHQLESLAQTRIPLASAPVLLLCLADTTAWKTAPSQLQGMVARKEISSEDAQEILREIRQYYSASPQVAERAALAGAFAALHQILSAAASYNLSAYWTSMFDEAKIKAHFHIPDHFLVAAVLALGHGEKPLPPPLEPLLHSLVYQDKFGEPFFGRE
jgi:nitroreductase